MSAATPIEEADLQEPAPIRRKRLEDLGEKAAIAAARTLAEQIAPQLEAHALAIYRTGLDTMADIATPAVQVRDCGVEIPPAKVLPETHALAVNGVIRLLIEANGNRQAGRYPHRVELPMEEATALAAVVEASLGLDTARLLDSNLFPTLP